MVVDRVVDYALRLEVVLYRLFISSKKKRKIISMCIQGFDVSGAESAGCDYDSAAAMMECGSRCGLTAELYATAPKHRFRALKGFRFFRLRVSTVAKTQGRLKGKRCDSSNKAKSGNCYMRPFKEPHTYPK